LCARLAAQQASQKPSSSGTAKIEVEANSVLVPVVVRDSQGRAVGTLKKEDFQVFDRKKPQVISGFTIERRTELESTGKISEPAAEPAPVTPTVAPQPASVPARFIVFLFDELCREWGRCRGNTR
jgi:hypothetical protein